MEAEQHLAELHKLATARLKACNVAAKHQGLALVDGERLAKLEAFAAAMTAAFAGARMTRDYADVQKNYPNEGYNGKRWLLPRNETEAAYRVLTEISNVRGPAGCLAGGE